MNALKERLKKKYGMEDRKAFLFCYVMIGIAFFFFCFFWLNVNLSSIALAFQDDSGNLTFANFKEVWKAFTDVDMFGWNLGKTLGRTIALWFCVNVLCVLPSMISTYILYKKMPGHYVFRVIFMIPTILNGIVWVMIMKNMVSLNGPIVTILSKLGVNFSPEVRLKGLLGSTGTAFLTVSLIAIMPHLVGFNMIISGAYSRIPGELFEVGRLEGVGFIREFFVVSVPLIWPTLVVTLIGNMSHIFTFDGNVFLYTMGNYETSTMGFYLYYITFKISGSGLAQNSYGYPAAIGLTITLITIPVVLFGKYVLERASEPVEF